MVRVLKIMVGQNHVLNGLIMALIVSSTAIKFLI